MRVGSLEKFADSRASGLSRFEGCVLVCAFRTEAEYFRLPIRLVVRAPIELELELELILSQMAQKPMLRG